MKKQPTISFQLFTTLMLGAMLVVAGCSSPEKKAEAEEVKAEAPAPAANPEEVQVSETHQQAAGIEVGGFQWQNVATEVQANGSIEVPPQNRISISAVMGGYVQKVNVLPGQTIKAGTVVAVLRHPDYLKLQQDYLQSRARVRFLAEELERQQVLDAEDVGAKRKLQQARADYASEQAAERSLAGQVRLLGLSVERLNTGHITSSVPLITPISGNVKAVNINPGQYVDPQNVLVEIVNRDDLHLELKVFEKDVAKVRVGQPILFSVQNRGTNEEFKARVFLVGTVFEDEARTVRVHAHLEPERFDLLPGQFVAARIQTAGARQRTLPEYALVQAGEFSYAFVRTQQDSSGRATFRRVKVRTGASVGGDVAVTLLEPTADTTYFVRRGAYFLNAEIGKGQNDED